MKNMVRNSIVYNDIKRVYNDNLSLFEQLQNKTILITGATGLIGSFLIRCLLYANKQSNLNIKILALVRNKAKAKEYFYRELHNNALKLLVQDVSESINSKENVDYIVHCASNTSSQSFVDYPVETLNTIIEGTKNILEFAKKAKIKGMVYLSSMEVYGELEIDKGPTKEENLGYIDILKPRSSYQMAKRIAESYCSYYSKEYNVPAKIARLSQILSSSADYNDSRVFAYFARCIVEKKDIVLNTPADVIRSFCYITDAISAILTLLINGENGKVYNVSNENAISKIKDIAQKLSVYYPSSKLVFDLKENTVYPATTNWQLDSSSLKLLGWSAKVSLKEMFDSVISSFVNQLSLKNVVKKEKNIILQFLEWLIAVRNRGYEKCFILFGRPIIKIDRKKLFEIFYSDLPIKKNKIVVNNFNGKNLYGCNPKYIIDEILKRKLNYEIVWALRGVEHADKSSFPKEVRLVNYRGRKIIKELAEAKLILGNVQSNEYLKRGWKKKKNQCYLQTWHGSLGIKRIGVAIDKMHDFVNSDVLNLSEIDANYTDILLSNSSFEDDVFKTSFCTYNGPILKYGHPRNDIFFKSEEEIAQIKNSIYEKYNISKSKKTVLYVPTFRDNFKLDCYNLQSKILLNALKERFGEDFVLLVRMHPHLKKQAEILFDFSDNVINVSEYADIQELLVSSDVAITDYSSCIFDFMLTRKPAFIFATDIEYFNNDRGFYYPLEETPFPVAKTNDELAQNILKFDMDKYSLEVEQFLKDKGCMEDGQASKRVVDLIEKIIG